MSHTINPSIYKKLPFDPIADFSPVVLAATAPNVLVVNPGVGAKSVAELVQIAKARPGKLNFPSSGNGGVSHLSDEMFRYAAGIDIVHVPYRGAGPALTALLANETQLMMATTPVALPQMKAGRSGRVAATAARVRRLRPKFRRLRSPVIRVSKPIPGTGCWPRRSFRLRSSTRRMRR